MLERMDSHEDQFAIENCPPAELMPWLDEAWFRARGIADGPFNAGAYAARPAPERARARQDGDHHRYERVWSYADLIRRVAALSAVLKGRFGIRPGHRIVLYSRELAVARRRPIRVAAGWRRHRHVSGNHEHARSGVGGRHDRGHSLPVRKGADPGPGRPRAVCGGVREPRGRRGRRAAAAAARGRVRRSGGRDRAHRSRACSVHLRFDRRAQGGGDVASRDRARHPFGRQSGSDDRGRHRRRHAFAWVRLRTLLAACCGRSRRERP